MDCQVEGRNLSIDSRRYFLKASTDFGELASLAEKCLSSLRYEFIRNGVSDLAEYEILKPSYFRIVIEKRKDLEVGNMLLPSIKQAKGSTVEIRFSSDHSERHNQEARMCAQSFVNLMVKELPVPPWEGLRFRESGREKRRWKEVLG